MREGFTFTVTPEESTQLGLGNYPSGHECTFMVKAQLKKNDNATLTFQATEIDKVGVDAIPTDLVGASPMYKAGMSPAEKKPVQYMKMATEPYVS